MMSTTQSTTASRRDPVVFIVDDDPDVRHSIELLAKSVQLSAQSYSATRDFLQEYDEDQPGCLVLDVRMPEMSGLELQEELNSRGVEIPIIMITAHGEVPMATRAMRGGALDFMQKPFSRHDLLERINQAIDLDGRNREQRQKRLDFEARVAKLSDREREVMDLLLNGKSTKVIASLLDISIKTVDNHRAKVLEKMKVDDVPKLILLQTRSL